MENEQLFLNNDPNTTKRMQFIIFGAVACLEIIVLSFALYLTFAQASIIGLCLIVPLLVLRIIEIK